MTKSKNVLFQFGNIFFPSVLELDVGVTSLKYRPQQDDTVKSDSQLAEKLKEDEVSSSEEARKIDSPAATPEKEGK